MSQWYVWIGGEQQGPFSSAELKRKAFSGEITAETQICKAGTENWAPASSVKGLLGASSPKNKVPAAPSNPPPVPATPPSSVDVSRMPTPQTPSEATAPDPPRRSGIPIALIALMIVGFVAVAAISAGIAVAIVGNRDTDETKPGKEVAGSQSNPGPNRSQSNPGPNRSQSNPGPNRGQSNPGSNSGKNGRNLPTIPPRRPTGNPQPLNDLSKNKKTLENQRDALKEEIQNLQDEKDELEAKIEDLTALWDELKAFHELDLVMINPSHKAVAFKQLEDGQLKLEREASEATTNHAIGAALNGRVKFISVDPQLTREIAQEFNPGDIITGELRDRLEEYWNDQPLLPDNLSEESPWVTFFDTATQARKVGLFIAADEVSMTYYNLGQGTQVVNRSRILPGSAVKGSLLDVMPSLDESFFVDLCCLMVAKKVQNEAGIYGTHSVIVDVELDLPDRRFSSQYRDLQLPNNEDIPEEFPKVKLAYFLFQLAYVLKHNGEMARERARIQKLEDAAHYLSDEILSKLTKVGVIVADRPRLEEILLARGLTAESDLTSAGLLPVSHVLSVKVKPPISGGRYYMNVSLIDATNGRVLFSENADHVDEI